MILDTSKAIERYNSEDSIEQNITIVTVIEFTPVVQYEKFSGEIYTVKPEDQIKAIQIQQKLREKGEPAPFPDLLVAAIAINRNETLETADEDFKPIEKATELELE
ncbi:MAG: DNA-binding protein [Candidatus Nanohaloarchaea archaeon]